MTPNRKNIQLEIVGTDYNGNPIARATEKLHDISEICYDTRSATENMRRAEAKLLRRAEHFEREYSRAWWERFMADYGRRLPKRKLRFKRRKTSRDINMRRR